MCDLFAHYWLCDIVKARNSIPSASLGRKRRKNVLEACSTNHQTKRQPSIMVEQDSIIPPQNEIAAALNPIEHNAEGAVAEVRPCHSFN